MSHPIGARSHRTNPVKTSPADGSANHEAMIESLSHRPSAVIVARIASGRSRSPRTTNRMAVAAAAEAL